MERLRAAGISNFETRDTSCPVCSFFLSLFFFFSRCNFPRPPSWNFHLRSTGAHIGTNVLLVVVTTVGGGNGRHHVKTPVPAPTWRDTFHYRPPSLHGASSTSSFSRPSLSSRFSLGYSGSCADRRSHGNLLIYLLHARVRNECLLVRTGYDVRSEVVRSSLSYLLADPKAHLDTAGHRSGSVSACPIIVATLRIFIVAACRAVVEPRAIKVSAFTLTVNVTERSIDRNSRSFFLTL